MLIMLIWSTHREAGVMAQVNSSNHAFQDWSSVSNTCVRQLTAACNSSWRQPDALFWPPQDMQSHACTN